MFYNQRFPWKEIVLVLICISTFTNNSSASSKRQKLIKELQEKEKKALKNLNKAQKWERSTRIFKDTYGEENIPTDLSPTKHLPGLLRSSMKDDKRVKVLQNQLQKEKEKAVELAYKMKMLEESLSVKSQKLLETENKLQRYKIQICEAEEKLSRTLQTKNQENQDMKIKLVEMKQELHLNDVQKEIFKNKLSNLEEQNNQLKYFLAFSERDKQKMKQIMTINFFEVKKLSRALYTKNEKNKLLKSKLTQLRHELQLEVKQKEIFKNKSSNLEEQNKQLKYFLTFSERDKQRTKEKLAVHLKEKQIALTDLENLREDSQKNLREKMALEEKLQIILQKLKNNTKNTPVISFANLFFNNFSCDTSLSETIKVLTTQLSSYERKLITTQQNIKRLEEKSKSLGNFQKKCRTLENKHFWTTLILGSSTVVTIGTVLYLYVRR